MKNFVNKHETLLFVLALMPIGAFLYVISKGIFDYLNLTILLIQIGLFLIQLTAFILLYFVSDEYKIHFKNPFKSLWFWLRYKRVKEIKKKSCYGCVLESENGNCKIKNGDYCWLNNSIYINRSYNPLNWLKKLFAITVIALLFSSCSVYVNCNFNKVPKYKTTQQDSTVLMINEYWF